MYSGSELQTVGTATEKARRAEPVAWNGDLMTCWPKADAGGKQCQILVCYKSDTEELGCAGIDRYMSTLNTHADHCYSSHRSVAAPYTVRSAITATAELLVESRCRPITAKPD